MRSDDAQMPPGVPAPGSTPSAPTAHPPPGSFPPVTRKEIFAWCCFDFANSSFTTVLVSVVFVATFTNVLAPAESADSLWGLAIFIAQLVVVVLSPFLGAWADIFAAKKKLLFCSYITCVVFTASLWFFGPGAWQMAMACFIIAYIAFSLGENFTASFLPELATPANIGRISGYGWSFGYLGGLASLGLCFPLIGGGFTAGNLASLQLTNLVVAVFFAITAIPTFVFLHERALPRPDRPAAGALFVGIWAQVFGTLRKMALNNGLRTAFGSFFLYMCGVCVIITYSTPFAIKALGMQGKELILLFLIIQVTSAIGAFLFGFVQDKVGSIRTLQITLVIWTLVVIAASMVCTGTQFMILGNLAGLVIGATQAASRALVAQLAPESQHAEYFGLWALFGKLAGGCGPLLFGLLIGGPEDYPFALCVTTVFFLAGLVWLSIGAEDLAAQTKRVAETGRA
ncbi:MFS transporter [Verrucomicrobia bacterium LW23]|nr:MFS transporter [Verrucomicrobia bacterium LW23]